MARELIDDFLHSFRFHAATLTDYDPLSAPGTAEAGFNNMTTPELTIEAVEYKEGLDIYPRKYPGAPTVNEITLSRGVTFIDTSFWQWARATVEGADPYRIDLEIKHYHRGGFLTTPRTTLATADIVTRGESSTPARRYQLYEAFPIRHKPAADLDATSAEVSLMELDVAFESFNVFSAAAGDLGLG
jgi:phage tail-like protein